MDLVLEKKIQLYRTVIDSLPYSTGIFDTKFRYLFINKAAEALCGLPMTEVVGKTPYDILPFEMCEDFVPLIKKCIESKETLTERVHFNFSGTELLLNLTYVPVLNDEDEVEFIIALTEDWTELEDQRSEAIANSRLASLGHMAANITHEINNPMQLVQLRLLRLEEMIKSDPANTKIMLTEIKDIFRTTNRVSEIIESIRQQAKRYAHDELSSVYTSAIIEEAIAYSKNIVDQAKVELILNFKSDSKVVCNPIEIEQVLINLISNSCDAIKSLENPKIIISSFVEKDETVIHVQDSGTGIDSETQKNLMKPFFTTKGVKKGTGLGLNLSRTLIKRNGGQLSYLPAQEKTTFEIRLKKV